MPRRLSRDTDRVYRPQVFTPRIARVARVAAPAATAAPERTVRRLLRYRLGLDAALATSRVPLSGNVFWITSASGSDAVCQIQFVYSDGSIGDLIDVAQGFRLFGHDYDAVLVTCSAQASKYLVITYGTANPGTEGDTI